MKISYACLKEEFRNPEPILQDIKKLVKAGQFTLGAPVEEFEKKFAKLQGVKYAVGVSSGTDGLLLALRALGVEPGDEVITVPTSFIATAAVIDLLGAKVVFSDVNREFVMDPGKIENAITRKTKAIIPVHWGGNPADMPKIMKVAKKHKLRVLEDAAPAVMAAINGKPVGGFGDAGEFSFHPFKNFCVWGEGGAVTTNKKLIADKVKLLRNHGLENRDEAEFFGFNNRMHTVQAAVGLHMLLRIEKITKKRIEIAKEYDETLENIGQISIPPRRPGVRHVYNNYMVQAQDRDRLLAHLLKKGIDAKIHYPIPLHLHKAAKHLGYKKGDFPVAEEVAKTVISLPNHHFLTRPEISYVADTVRKFYSR